LLNEFLKYYDKNAHKLKTPDQGTSSATKPKTILLNATAIKILEKIKTESKEPKFTFSDVIDFLVRKNALADTTNTDQSRLSLDNYIEELLFELNSNDEVSLAQILRIVQKKFPETTKELLEELLLLFVKRNTDFRYIRLKESIRRDR
jgi:hypothetical protein